MFSSSSNNNSSINIIISHNTMQITHPLEVVRHSSRCSNSNTMH